MSRRYPYMEKEQDERDKVNAQFCVTMYNTSYITAIVWENETGCFTYDKG